MPSVRLSDDAVQVLMSYGWPGNIRQLKNLVEQISVIETSRELDAAMILSYLPAEREKVPAIMGEGGSENFSERELMYKFLFDMKKDLSDLKKLVIELVHQNGDFSLSNDQTAIVNRLYKEVNPNFGQSRILPSPTESSVNEFQATPETEDFETHEEVEESLSLEDREKELIQKALEKHRGKRKYAAAELGISERTLYRKIKEYNLME
jgi:DNA-binding NtrC family response regulator